LNPKDLDSENNLLNSAKVHSRLSNMNNRELLEFLKLAYIHLYVSFDPLCSQAHIIKNVLSILTFTIYIGINQITTATKTIYLPHWSKRPTRASFPQSYSR